MDTLIKTINFNQDFSCLAIGTSTDYKVYNCDPFGQCFHKNDDGGASIVEMLFSTSLIAIVGLGDKPATSTRRLKIINTKRKSIICELTFPTSVLSVKLNRKRLIVVLFDQIYIYDVSCMKLLHTIETVPNKLATVSLSSNDDSILCFPSSSLSMVSNVDPLSSSQLSNDSSQRQTSHTQQQQHHQHQQVAGNIVIFDALNIQRLNVVQAHKSSLASITLSSDGKLVATASSKGTIIRVFNTTTCKRMFEFRRGSYETHIRSLNFNHDNTLLCCSSGTGTIHIFKLNEETSVPVNLPDVQSHDSPSQSVVNLVSSNDEEPEQEQEQEERVIPQEVPEAYVDSEELNQILNIDKSRAQGGKRSSSLSEYLWSKSSNITKNVKGQLNNYLPTKVQSILEPKRDFAFIKLPTNNYPSFKSSSSTSTSTSASVKSKNDDSIPNNIDTIVGINSNNNNVMCADNYGNFYVYNIPMDKGGECILVKQFSFKEPSP